MFARGEWYSFVWIFSAPSQKSSYATVYARGLHIHRYLTNIISLSSWTQDCKVAPAFEIQLSLLLVHWKYWPCRLTIAKLEESRRISTTFLVSFMMALALACNGWKVGWRWVLVTHVIINVKKRGPELTTRLALCAFIVSMVRFYLSFPQIILIDIFTH